MLFENKELWTFGMTSINFNKSSHMVAKSSHMVVLECPWMSWNFHFVLESPWMSWKFHLFPIFVLECPWIWFSQWSLENSTRYFPNVSCNTVYNFIGVYKLWFLQILLHFKQNICTKWVSDLDKINKNRKLAWRRKLLSQLYKE